VKNYYDRFLKEYDLSICECGKPTFFKSIMDGYCDFCSYECANKRKGSKLSQVKTGKPNVKLRGYKQSAEHIGKRILKGEQHPMHGRLGADHPSYGKPGLVGSANPNWQGGKSFEDYGLEFIESLKRQIRMRDGYRCSMCHISEDDAGSALSVHHIDYDKKNNSIENLISLCVSCHARTNWGRSEWQRLFEEKMSTPLLAFNLKNEAGLPAMDEVFERVPA
jgi:hypothetical protein